MTEHRKIPLPGQPGGPVTGKSSVERALEGYNLGKLGGMARRGDPADVVPVREAAVPAAAVISAPVVPEVVAVPVAVSAPAAPEAQLPRSAPLKWRGKRGLRQRFSRRCTMRSTASSCAI